MAKEVSRLRGSGPASKAPAAASKGRPRIAEDVEAEVLALGQKHPGFGQDRVSRELTRLGMPISASGVRYVWQRHDLGTIFQRVRRIENILGTDEAAWSREQLRARNLTVSKLRLREREMQNSHDAPSPRGAYILGVAASLLRTNGYDATSLRDIAKVAGLPAGSLYHYFQTKEDLFAAVHSEGIKRLTTEIERAIVGIADPWKRLEAACITHLEQLCGGDDFTAASVPTSMPKISASLHERLARQRDGYEAIFRKLIAALRLPRSASPTLVRLQLLGALNWTRMWFKPGKSSAAKIGRHLATVLKFGLEQQVKGPRFRARGQ